MCGACRHATKVMGQGGGAAAKDLLVPLAILVKVNALQGKGIKGTWNVSTSENSLP